MWYNVVALLAAPSVHAFCSVVHRDGEATEAEVKAAFGVMELIHRLDIALDNSRSRAFFRTLAADLLHQMATLHEADLRERSTVRHSHSRPKVASITGVKQTGDHLFLTEGLCSAQLPAVISSPTRALQRAMQTCFQGHDGNSRRMMTHDRTAAISSSRRCGQMLSIPCTSGPCAPRPRRPTQRSLYG